MGTLTFTMAFLMGFTGSLHCAGMCGPIMWVMPFQLFKGAKKGVAIGLYHLGRISVYASLAVILHSFRALFEPRVQQYISMALGATLLLVGVLSFIPNNVVKIRLPWAEQVKTALGRTMVKPGLGKIAAAGILNGLLPCGLVYMALSASLTAASVMQAGAFMYIFGMGTLPMLLSITLLKTRLAFLRSAHIRKLVPVTLFAFGCLFLLRGMNLGIPYLSPRIAVVGHEIKACCCHRK